MDTTNNTAAKSDTAAPQEAEALFCEKHRTALIREVEHVGEGNTQLGKPFCPLCEEQKANAEKADDAAAPAAKPAPAPVAQPAAKPAAAV